MPLSRDDRLQLLLYCSCNTGWSLAPFSHFYREIKACTSTRTVIYERSEESVNTICHIKKMARKYSFSLTLHLLLVQIKGLPKQLSIEKMLSTNTDPSDQEGFKSG